MKQQHSNSLMRYLLIIAVNTAVTYTYRYHIGLAYRLFQ